MSLIGLLILATGPYPATHYAPVSEAEKARRIADGKLRLPEANDIWVDEVGFAQRVSVFDPSLSRPDISCPLSNRDRDRLLQFLLRDRALFGFDPGTSISFEPQSPTFLQEAGTGRQVLSEERWLVVQRIDGRPFAAPAPLPGTNDGVGFARSGVLEIRRFLQVSVNMLRQTGRIQILGHHWPGATLPRSPTLSVDEIRGAFAGRARDGPLDLSLRALPARAAGGAIDLRLVYAIDQRSLNLTWWVDAMTGNEYSGAGDRTGRLSRPSPTDPCAGFTGDPGGPTLGPPPSAMDDATFCGCQEKGKTCAHWRTWSGMYGCGAVRQVPRTCFCGECSTDADCIAGKDGRCLQFTLGGGPCGNPSAPYVCVYAGNPCHPAGSCPSGQICQGDASGHPSCAVRYSGPMPP